MAAEHPLKPLCSKWIDKLKKAHEVKKREFQNDADECMKFFDGGAYNWLYGSGADSSQLGITISSGHSMPTPTFRMNANKAAEMVQLFGPVLYQKNPHKTIEPRLISNVQPPPQVQQAMAMMQQADQAMQQGIQIPPEFFQQYVQAQMLTQQWQQLATQAQTKDQTNAQRAELLSTIMNYTPYELGSLFEIRGAIDEAIIKGMGVLWTSVEQFPTGHRVVGQFMDSVDNLLMDPDAEKPSDCWWIAQRCTHAVWDVEREYGLKPGSLKGKSETWDSQCDQDDTRKYKRAQGGTNDLITYWKIYSKMGVGGRMKDADEATRQTLEAYGDYCLIVVAEDVPYPLNLPPEVINTAPDEEVKKRLQWPAPFYADRAWPMTPIYFHPVPRRVWPMSHLKPGLGYLTFLNWAYSFLMGKVAVTSRDFVVVAKSAGDDIKRQMESGKDLTILEINAAQQDIDKIVQFLQHPAMNLDLAKVVVPLIAQEFDRAVGLTDLMYGESKRQYRSAVEAEVKQQATSIRPDDMRSMLVAQLTEAAKKEAIAIQTILQPKDLEPVLGPLGLMAWQMAMQGATIPEIVHQLSYRIEADDTRIPNREKQAQDMQTVMQNLSQPFMTLAMEGGNVGPINALLMDFFKTIDLDGSKYQFPAPPPPVPPTPEQPKISVAIKGEDIEAMGLWPAIQQAFGVEVTKEMEELPSSEAATTTAEAAEKKANQKPATPAKKAA